MKKLFITIIILSFCITLSAFGQSQTNREETQKATDNYLKKIRSAPDDLDLHRELVDTYKEKGLISIPIEVYNLSLAKNPDNAIVPYVLGYAYLIEGSPESLKLAEKNLKIALGLKPDFPDALTALGDYYWKTGQDSSALEKWQEARRTNERFEPVYVSLGRYYRSKRQYDKALEEYDEAISLNPKQIGKRYLELGLTYLEMDDLDKAEESLIKAKSYEPKLGIIYYKLGQIYAKKGDRDQAIRLYRDGRKHDPDNAQSAYELAYIFLEKNDVKYALLSFERGLSADGLAPNVSKELIKQIDKGVAQAENYLTQLSDSSLKSNFNYLYFLGKLYLNQKNDDLAFKYLKLASSMPNSNADVYYQLGLLYDKLQPKEAKEPKIEKANIPPKQESQSIESGHEEVKGQVTQPERAIQKGEAQEQYRKAVELGASEADLLFKVAQGYLDEGQEDKYIEVAEKALTIPVPPSDGRTDLVPPSDGRTDLVPPSDERTDGTNPDSLPIVISDKPSILPDVVATYGQIHLFWTKVESDSRSKILYMRRDTLPPNRPETPVHFDLTANPGYDDDKNMTFSWTSLVPPSNGRTESEPQGTVKYNVYASVDNGEFTLVGSSDKTTYDLTGESGKVYRIYVEAVDNVGNVSVPSGISQKVISDPDPPEVIIHSPGSNSIVRGNVPITISVNDDNLLKSDLEYGVSSFPSAWESLAGPFHENMDRILIMTWDTKNLDGIYTIRLTATDKAGNESKTEAVIDIDSSSPIAISSGEFTKLTPSDIDWNYGTPAWSPTGDKIAFYSDEGGTEDLWVMSPDGKNRSRLTRSTDIKRHPSWSPSGDTLVYESLPAISKLQPSKPEQWKLWLISSDGKNARQITSGEGSDTNPSWSPDGSAIAFDSNVDGNYEIWLITNISKVITGASPQYAKLTDNKWDNRNPEWSPDGSKIIFQSNGKGSWDIMEIGVDGANLNTVVATPSDEIEPDWSSDGKWILYSTNETSVLPSLGGTRDDHYEIRAINLPERSEQIILSSPDNDAHNAQWSPKMDVVVYESQNSLFTAAIIHPVRNLEAIISWPRGGE
ncbi:MAG: Fibronectin type-III protein, partial [Candidatus Poribacteria bacterium]|nr:Fibronectin type-III protein [Candidatus Poribacteria bacterium]